MSSTTKRASLNMGWERDSFMKRILTSLEIMSSDPYNVFFMVQAEFSLSIEVFEK